jgi:type IV secretory pathway VirB10-like protein
MGFAVLLHHGIHSDLPGQVTAQVTENVYDSPTGQYLLVPQGARLIGSKTPMSPSGRAASCWCGRA